MQTLHDHLIVLRVALDHVGDGRIEPIFEVVARIENVGHQKVQERPQFHEIVLKRRAGEEEATPRPQVHERSPSLAFEVFDVLSLNAAVAAMRVDSSCARASNLPRPTPNIAKLSS